MDGRVELILGDARETIPRQKGPFDLVFLDAAKGQYIDYLDFVLPKVRPGGFIVAHNVVSHQRQLQDFLARVGSDSQLETTFKTLGPGGFSVSRKRAKP